MNFIVRIFKNSNYLSRATISTSIAAYFSLDTSFAWSWLYYNKIYDVIDFHQGDIFFSLSIPLGISKLETSRKEEKRKRKEDLSKTSFSISRPKIGDSSLPSPLLFSRKARDKEQENGEREREREHKRKIEGVTVPRPPPTWLRHERKLRAKQPLSPGCYLYYSRHPGCHHCFDVPPPSPPNDHHAANRQNEPIIAAFVIFPWPPTTPSCSPSPCWANGENAHRHRIPNLYRLDSSFFSCRLPLFREKSLLLSVSRVEVTSYGLFLPRGSGRGTLRYGGEEDDSQRNGRCRGILSILRFGRMALFLSLRALGPVFERVYGSNVYYSLRKDIFILEKGLRIVSENEKI